MMNNYIYNINKIKKKSLFENKNASIDIYSKNRLDFLRFRFNIKYILSYNNKDKDLLNLFLSIKTYQAISEFDIQRKDSYNSIKLTDSFFTTNTPKIFCSFHLGSYSVIPHVLIKYCQKLAIIINKKTIISKGNLFNQLINTSNNINNVTIIDAEEDYSILNIVKKIKQGFSLLVYLDGNTGVGGFERKDKKLEIINFFNRKILCRKGVAFLAYKLNLPIISIYTYRKNNKNLIHFDPPITKESIMTDNIDIFCKKCIQKIWRNFEFFMLPHKEQWEAWLYINGFYPEKNNSPKNIIIPKNVINNSKLYVDFIYEFFTQNNKYYIFNNNTGTIHEISKVIFIILLKMKNNNVIIHHNELSQLLSENILYELININILKLKS